MAEDLPSKIGRYDILRRLGRGGMGTVFLASDPELDRRVAIKVLNDNSQELRDRFGREGRAAARLRHQNIVTVFDVGEFEGQPFLAMEYIDGTSLDGLIASKTPIPQVRVLQIVEELCFGLAHAHRSGVVHRDIKPGNIAVTAEGTVKILDFGIARQLQPNEAASTQGLIGTLNYMSPEQMSGRPVDHRSDIFSVGAVFYELLADRRAFPGSLGDGLYQRILNEPPQPVASLVDPEVVAILTRALEKDPDRRYQQIDRMAADLAQVRIRLQAGTDATTVAFRVGARARRRWFSPVPLLIAAAVLVALLAALMATASRRGSQSPETSAAVPPGATQGGSIAAPPNTPPSKIDGTPSRPPEERSEPGPPAATGRTTRSPMAIDPKCERLLERITLGEPLSALDRAYLRERCER